MFSLAEATRTPSRLIDFGCLLESILQSFNDVYCVFYIVNNSDGQTVTNIGAAECRKRERISVTAFALTVLMFVALRAAAVEQGWYLLLFVPAWMAVLGLLQARERT